MTLQACFLDFAPTPRYDKMKAQATKYWLASGETLWPMRAFFSHLQQEPVTSCHILLTVMMSSFPGEVCEDNQERPENLR